MNTFWIITAPSCVGKTTFIDTNTRLAEITGLKRRPKIAAPPLKLPVNETTYFHRCMAFNSCFQFCRDIQIDVKAIVLVATTETTKIRRNMRREDLRKGLSVAAVKSKHFSPEEWLTLYNRSLNEFEELKVPYILLNTEMPSYPIITRSEMETLLK